MRSKKVRIAIGVFLFLVVAGVALTWYFRGKILDWVKSGVSEQLNVEVDFSGLGVSLIKDYPKLSVRFTDLSLVGRDQFAGDTLFSAEDVGLAIDAWSLLRSEQPIDVKKIYLNKPHIRLIVLDSAHSNYLFYPQEASSSGSGEEMRLLELRSMEIVDGRFSYRDFPGQLEMRFTHLNHHGSGSWSGEQIQYVTQTTLDSLYVRKGAISYLKNVDMDWKADFSWHPDSRRLELGENLLRLNAMQLSSSGELVAKEDRMTIHMKIQAPNSPFKELFSLLPNAYTKDFSNLQAKGNFSLSGEINGDMYYEKALYPDFDFALQVQDGYVKYPDLPKAIEQVQMKMNVSKKGPSLDATVVDIPGMSFVVDGEPLQLHTHITHPLSALNAKGGIKGNLNLESLSKAYPIQDVQTMQGRVGMDVSFRFNRALTEKYLAGSLHTTGVHLQYGDYPKMRFDKMEVSFAPEKIRVERGQFAFGDSDYDGSIQVVDPLHYFARTGSVTVLLQGKMHRLNVDEWVSEETPTAPAEPEPIDPQFYDFITRRLRLKADMDIQKLQYTGYDIGKLRLKGGLEKDRLSIDRLRMLFFGSPMEVSGHLEGLFAWLWKDAPLRGKLEVRSVRFDADRYLAEPEETQNASAEAPFELPEKMDVQVKMAVGKMLYDKTEYHNIRGQVGVGDRKVLFQDMKMDGLGGTMALSGALQTPKGQAPAYDIRFAGQKVQFVEMLRSVKPIHKLMPIFEFFRGALNADFSFSGTLDKDMSPVLTGLNAKGFLETIRTYIANYPPVRALGDQLHIKSLKEDNIPVKQVKTWFEIENGKVHFKPFVIRYKNVEINMEGYNSLDKNIDYTVVASIPTDILEKIPGHEAVQKGKDWLSAQLKKLGVDYKKKSRLKTRIHLVGPYNDPKVKIRLDKVAGESSLEDKGQEVLDSVKSKALDTLNKMKDAAVERARKEAEEKAQAARDSIKKRADEEVARAKEKAKAKVKEEIKKKAGKYVDSTLIDNTTKKAKEKAKEKAKKKAKEVLDKWNPFKKNKKG